MAKSGECQVCGRKMSQFFKGEICSAACRQKKARNKRNASKIAMRVRNDLRTLKTLADNDTLDYWKLSPEYQEIRGLVSDFYDALELSFDRMQARDARRVSSE